MKTGKIEYAPDYKSKQPKIERLPAVRSISSEDLYHALRLDIEGTDADKRMYLKRMAKRYPHIKELHELVKKHSSPFDILR